MMGVLQTMTMQIMARAATVATNPTANDRQTPPTLPCQRQQPQ